MKCDTDWTFPASGNIKTSLKKRRNYLNVDLRQKGDGSRAAWQWGREWAVRDGEEQPWTEEESAAGCAWRSHLELWVFCVLSPVIGSR